MYYFDTQCNEFLEQQLIDINLSNYEIIQKEIHNRSTNDHQLTIFYCKGLALEVCSVRTSQKQVVNLIEETYTSSKFQEMYIPYSHVIVACMFTAINYE